MCWLYFVPNLLVIQQLDTLYLGGGHVRVVCEKMWRIQVCVQSKAFLRLELASDLRLELASDSWLMTRQSATRVKYTRSWKVMTTGALQDKKDSLASQLFHD